MTSRENKLTKQVEELARLVKQLEASNQQLMDRNKLLDERLRIELLKKYGQKREKFPTDNNFLPGLEPNEATDLVEPAEVSEEKVLTQKGKRKKQRSFTDLEKNLETKIKVLKFSDEQVEKDGLVAIGYDSYKRIVVVPSKYYVEETQVMKYAIREFPSAGIIMPERPKGAIAGSYFDASFYADILVKKYVYHLPLYRQEEMMKQLGLDVSRQTLSKMTLKLSDVIDNLVQLLKSTILDSKNVFLDETEVKLQAKDKCKKSYFWQMSGADPKFRDQIPDPPLVYFEFHDNRRHENVANLIGENYQGNFHSDAYKAYEQFAKKDGVNWQVCWAHARRNFFEATTNMEMRSKVVKLMDQLFEQERNYWELFENETSDEKLLKFRATNCKLIVDEIFSELKSFMTKGHYLPKEKIFTACTYMYSRMSAFKTFLQHPNVRIDNNVSERKIRPITIGRKNWIFVGSERGGKAAANIYSLVQTCRNLDIDPRTYLTDIFRRINNTSDLELVNLLPQNWSK